MSTKFYSFVAKSEDNLHEQIGIMKTLVKDLRSTNPEGIEMQVFRTSKGIRYRVLEVGYGLRNQMWKQPDIFPQCNYDDRADIPEADLPNKAMANEVDHLMRTGQYFIEEILVPSHGYE